MNEKNVPKEMCQNSLLAAPVYKSNKHQLAWQNEGTKYPRRRRNQVAISFHKELIGILMACSKKAVVVFLAVPLLMALLAATVSADLCGQVPHCEVNQCEASCFVTGHQGGTCKLIGGVPSCCCAGSSSASIGVHQLPH